MTRPLIKAKSILVVVWYIWPTYSTEDTQFTDYAAKCIFRTSFPRFFDERRLVRVPQIGYTNSIYVKLVRKRGSQTGSKETNLDINAWGY